MTATVRKELHIPAPEPHVAVYAQNPTYTALDGRSLIEAVKWEARTGSGLYYDRRIYRRRSEDNGRTWTDEPPLHELTDAEVDAGCEVRTVPMHFLDPDNGLLVSLHCTAERAGSDTAFHGAGDLMSRTRRFFCEVSRDGGLTWEDHGQVIMSGDEFDAVHWAPGVWYGRNRAQADMPPWVKLPDGTLVLGVSVQPLGEDGEMLTVTGGYFLQTAFLRARWREDLSGLDWEMGAPISVGPELSSVGCCEPALAHLGGQRLWTTMRCQGYTDGRAPSLKFMATSDDGGLTWTEPEPLRFDDGEPVNSPASLAEFVRVSGSERLWWIGNISPEPVYGQTPRYPLYIVGGSAASARRPAPARCCRSTT
ncbi:MAG: exo-alpha-sialidase, partial [Armatimonadetes bacterium]|nr:exo-alpha-sialidase [Armatimonadota bacterium]